MREAKNIWLITGMPEAGQKEIGRGVSEKGDIDFLSRDSSLHSISTHLGLTNDLVELVKLIAAEKQSRGVLAAIPEEARKFFHASREISPKIRTLLNGLSIFLTNTPSFFRSQAGLIGKMQRLAQQKDQDLLMNVITDSHFLTVFSSFVAMRAQYDTALAQRKPQLIEAPELITSDARAGTREFFQAHRADPGLIIIINKKTALSTRIARLPESQREKAHEALTQMLRNQYPYFAREGWQVTSAKVAPSSLSARILTLEDVIAEVREKILQGPAALPKFKGQIPFLIS